MTSQHAPVADLVYDLVSVQYHALKGVQTYDKYLQDAQDHPQVRAFFEQIAREDAERATRCHELLRELTRDRDLHKV